MLFGKTGNGVQVSSVSPGIVFEGPYLCLVALSPLHLLVETTLSTSLHLVTSTVDAVLLLCRAHLSWSIPNVFLMIQTGGGESKKSHQLCITSWAHLDILALIIWLKVGLLRFLHYYVSVCSSSYVPH